MVTLAGKEGGNEVCDLEICCGEEKEGLTGQPLLAGLLLPSVILPSLRILCLVTLDLDPWQDQVGPWHRANVT